MTRITWDALIFHLKFVASLPSFCQKLSKLVEIWRSSDKNNFAQFFFETRCRPYIPACPGEAEVLRKWAPLRKGPWNKFQGGRRGSKIWSRGVDNSGLNNNLHNNLHSNISASINNPATTVHVWYCQYQKCMYCMYSVAYHTKFFMQ